MRLLAFRKRLESNIMKGADRFASDRRILKDMLGER